MPLVTYARLFSALAWLALRSSVLAARPLDATDVMRGGRKLPELGEREDLAESDALCDSAYSTFISASSCATLYQGEKGRQIEEKRM
jgi:hypothetical protein